MSKYICIDIGGTAIKHGIIENGKILEKSVIDTPKDGREILVMTKKIVGEYISGGNYAGVCISSAGMVDVENGRIFHSADTIKNFKGTEFKREIENSFGIDCEVENDVNCAGLAESVAGAGVGCQSILCLTVGTGIGGCAIINGEVIHGFIGSACEVGYMLLPGGAFQSIAATSILVEKVADKKGESTGEWDGVRVFESAKNGDSVCVEAVDELCDALGLGIANICYVLNPQRVILGGGIMAQEDYLYKRIRESIDKYLVPIIASNTQLAIAKYKNDAGMIGAYYNFIKRHNL